MKPSPPVILFYDHVAKLSGGEILLWHLVSNLDRDQFFPVVVLGEEGPLRDQLKAQGVETHVLPLPDSIQSTRKDHLSKGGILKKLASLNAFYLYIWRLRGFIRRRGVSIVHTNSLKTDIIGGIAGKLARKPVIWHLHDCIDTAYLPNAAVIIFRKLARYLPTHVISVSRAVQETLHLPEGSAGTVVHNGIPAQERPAQERPAQESLASNRKKNSQAPLIGIVGRITPWKGQHVFIRAAAQVRENYPRARFQVVGSALFGEDDYFEELKALVRELHLEKAIEFLGFRNDVPQLVAEFDLFVHASTTPEPFGIVIIEAMMESKPVVATRGGGVPEIVVDGETGILVPMNDVDALANAMLQLLNNPDEMQRMGCAGQRRVHDHFLIGHTVEGVEGVYRGILKP